ncbi:Uncharacterized conserved protein, DUF934 family [Solimonas aquatica]|uniref:Uncharacterized conserved protein, DUF934 family n=1 Tax=Solimonas aquatica TaxID=489703 RepID=A0A1H9AQV2_9GAMM|nr:DUF934 domain-containing protein [Solimonas aquatica]SEP78298.1 Uncharacterized conserved protein, DUF934 family [Solimonas aquatica]
MSALIKNGALVADEYRALADEDALPAQGAVIVTLKRWLEQQEVLRASGLRVGVLLPNTLDVATQWQALSDRPLLVLDFPAFADGRAYSQARLLRERYGFAGEIRAQGAAVVRDQLHSLYRSGFTSFALRADQNPEQCLAALKDFTLAYQPTIVGSPLVRRLRGLSA